MGEKLQKESVMKKIIKKETKFGKYFYLVPITIILILVITIAVLWFQGKLTAENILNYTPDNLFLATVLICVFFTFKGLSVMFPGTVLYVLIGMIYENVWVALLVSIIGTIFEIAITYYMGHLCGETKFVRNLQKKPKFQKLFNEESKNERMLIYLSRILGLPYDIMGMFWGALGADFISYMIFSMLGKLPKVVIETVVGTTVNSRFSKSSIILFIVLFVVTLVITIISNKMSKRKN